MVDRLDIPDLVRQRAMSNGAVGRRWIDELPEPGGGLVERWDLELGESCAGGTAGFVVATTDSTGRAWRRRSLSL